MGHHFQARNCLRLRLIGACGLLLLFGPLALPEEAWSQTPPTKSLTAAQHDRLLKRDELRKEAQKSRAAGKFAEAIVLSEKALAIEREVLGESDIDTFRSTESLAWSCAVKGDFEAARHWIDQAQKAQAQVRPTGHWTLLDAERTRATIDKAKSFQTCSTRSPPRGIATTCADGRTGRRR